MQTVALSAEAQPCSSSMSSERAISTSTMHEPDPKSRRLHAGCRLGSNQASPQTRPGATTSPGFDIVDTLSTRHQRFAFARLSEPYLTGSRPAFSATLTTTALDRRSLRWFGACPLTAGSGGPTSISCSASHLLASVRSWHTVVGVAHDDHIARRLTPSPALGPEVEDVVQVDVGEQR